MNVSPRMAALTIKKSFVGLIVMLVCVLPTQVMADTLKSATFKYGPDFMLTVTFDGTIDLNEYNPVTMLRQGRMIVINATSAIQDVKLDAAVVPSGTRDGDALEWQKPEYMDNFLLYYNTLTGEFSVKKIHMLFSGTSRKEIRSSFLEVTSSDMVIGYIPENQGDTKKSDSKRRYITKLLTVSEFNNTTESQFQAKQDGGKTLVEVSSI